MTIEQADLVWGALSNPHRRRILDLLAGGPRTTGELNLALPEISRYAVMQHLGVLVEAGLVLPRSEGRYRYNHLNPVPIQLAYERWIQPLAARAAESMLAARRHLEIHTSPEETMSEKADRIVRIEAEIHLEASPEQVFEALTTGLDAWWPHRTRPDARIVYEPVAGGRVYEDWGEEGTLLYGQVLRYELPRVSMVLGPGGLGQGLFHERSIDALEPDGEGTLYRKSLLFWGAVPQETEDMFRAGMSFMEQHLKPYVEEGVGYAAPA